MKSIIILLAVCGTVFSQPKMGGGPGGPGGPCGSPPTKKPTECCADMGKLMTPAIISSCEGSGDPCSMGECYAKGLNFMANGQYDKAAATAALNNAFSGIPEWQPIITKAINECETAATSMKGPPCASDAGKKTLCVKLKLFAGCPKPQTNDPECDKAKTFYTCLGNQM